MEKIEIRGIGHPTDTMMTIESPEGERFLVFDKDIFPHLQMGTVVELEIKRDVAKKSGDGTYNLIKSVTIDGKVIGGKKRSGYASRGRDEDRTDRRNNLITIKDLWIAGKIKVTNPLVTWLLAELLVGATGKKEAKGETTNRQDGGETTNGEPATVGAFLTWLTNQGIKAPRAWLEVEHGVPSGDVLTLKKCQELYKVMGDK